MKSAILVTILFLATSLAFPTQSATSNDRLRSRLARRGNAAKAVRGHSSKTAPLKTVDVNEARERSFDQRSKASHISKARDLQDIYSTNWAGVILDQPANNQTYTQVSGRFVVPTVDEGAGDSDYWAASAWVGIDGYSHNSAILQTGVDFYIDDNGQLTFGAWYEWFPDYAYDLNLKISPGDTVALHVTAFTSTTGVAIIRNLTTGKSVRQTISSSFALAGENAEWIVEDFISGGGQVPLADWGTVQFNKANARTNKGRKVGLKNAIPVQMLDQDWNMITNIDIQSAHSVAINYVNA